MNFRTGRRFCLTMAWLLVLVTALPVLAFRETTVDGVVQVTNDAQPTEGVQKVQLEEVWRLGGADDDETIFGIINRALLGEDGNIYLLDAQLSEVTVVSPEGEVLGTLGREGDGPGEFRQPGDMCFMPDGTLGVMQQFPGKVVKVGLDNTPAGTLSLGNPAAGAFYMMRGLRQGGGHIVAGGTEQHFDQATGVIERETFLSSLSPEGMRDHTFTAKTMSMNVQNMRLDETELIDGPDRRFDVGPNGRLVAAIPRNGYEVSIFAPDGTLERVFTRPYEPWQRDERAAGIWQRIMDTIQSTQMPNAPITIEETEPDVEFLRVGQDNRIWVLNSRAMWAPPEGVFSFFDVFSPQGEFLKQVHIICDGDPQADFLFFANDELAFMVTGFWDAALSRFGGGAGGEGEGEPEPMSVVCYRVSS